MNSGSRLPNRGSLAGRSTPLTRIILAAVLAVAGPAFVGAGADPDQTGTLRIRWRTDDAITATYAISVKSYYDPDRTLDGYTTFAFDYANADDPLLEKELFKMVQLQLEARGMTRQDEGPQLLMRLIFVVKPLEDGTYLRFLQLNFLDAAELASGRELKVPPVVWKGEAASAGSASDIRKVAPLMFREMLFEFPVRTSRDERRTVVCMEYGEIGIAVDRRDWRVIKAVEPGSPAAVAGVTTNDSLEKINDATMSWRMSYRPEKEKYAWKRVNWVEGDYLFIRWPDESRSVMSLRLKAANGKTRTVKIPVVVKEGC